MPVVNVSRDAYKLIVERASKEGLNLNEALDKLLFGETFQERVQEIEKIKKKIIEIEAVLKTHEEKIGKLTQITDGLGRVGEIFGRAIEKLMEKVDKRIGEFYGIVKELAQNQSELSGIVKELQIQMADSSK